jgi:hypothetical protein
VRVPVGGRAETPAEDLARQMDLWRLLLGDRDINDYDLEAAAEAEAAREARLVALRRRLAAAAGAPNRP